MLLICLSCAWVAGILLGSVLAPPVALVLAGFTLLPLAFFFPQRRKQLVLASLCLVALLGGAARFQSSLPGNSAQDLHFYNSRGTVEIRGSVDADPETGDRNQRLRLAATQIRSGQEWQEVTGTAMLFVPRYPEYGYGDVLQVRGKLEKPTSTGNFDYQSFLAHQGIYSTMSYPAVELLDTGRGSKPLEWVYSLRNRLSLVLAQILPEPQASLAQGIFLGIRRNIPAAVNDNFSRTGTAHLLAISGQNLSIVAGILLALGVWLFGRRQPIYIWLALAVIWLYAVLTGMQPPVIRSAIMASLFLAAELLGRQRNALPALAFAAAIMVGLSPQVLWLASFQLSFLAMAGLILIAPHLIALGRSAIDSRLGEEGTDVSIARFTNISFSVSLAAVLAVWPVVAYNFGIVSFVAPVATLLALPALPGLTVSAALASGIGLVALAPAYVLGWLAWLFVSYILGVVNGFAALPLSSIKAGAVSPAFLSVYYSILAAAVLCVNHRQKMAYLTSRIKIELKSGMGKVDRLLTKLPLKWVLPPLLAIAVLLIVAVAVLPDDKLHVSFLDVGQGDAILVRRGSQQVLIDGGPSPQAMALALGDRMPFWDRNIEMVILTHPHADHLAGLEEVLRRYRVEQVVCPDLDYISPENQEWRKLIGKGDIRHSTARAGMRLDLGGGVTIDVLNPPNPLWAGTESDIDNNGAVLRLSDGRVSFLITGDLQWEAESELVSRRADLRSTVLKVAHHGSNTSTTSRFLAVADPRVAVIQVGAGNSFGHPTAEVLQRLQKKLGAENVYRTDRNGAIEFTTDGERLWVKVGK